MGFFDKLSKVVDFAETAKKIVDEIGETTSKLNNGGSLNLASSSHLVTTTEYGDDDAEYTVSFVIDDSFKELNSGAGEVIMLNVYSPEDDDVENVKYPYIAIEMDNQIYNAVAEYKEKGTFTGAIDLTPLSGRFLFKAKMEYHGNMLYFYGLDRCEGFWENNGLCLVYQKQYVGTEYETTLMRLLDDVAASYKEEKNGR